MTLRHVHASGKSSTPAATVPQLNKALTRYAQDHHADVITLTEMGGSTIALARWASMNTWHLYQPLGWGRSECAILSRTPLDHRRATRLSPYRLRTARSAPLYATTARVSGGPWFSVTHTPAHNGGLSTVGAYAWPTHVYLSVIHGWHVARHRMRGHGVVLAADWNLNLRLDKVRRRLARPFPGMVWGWHPGQEPTEGGRVIDGVLTNLRIVVPSKTLPAQPGFDHRAVLTVLGP